MIRIGNKYKVFFAPSIREENDTIHNRIGVVTQILDETSYYVMFPNDSEEYIIYLDELKPISNEATYIAYEAINDPED